MKKAIILGLALSQNALADGDVPTLENPVEVLVDLVRKNNNTKVVSNKYYSLDVTNSNEPFKIIYWDRNTDGKLDKGDFLEVRECIYQTNSPELKISPTSKPQFWGDIAGSKSFYDTLNYSNVRKVTEQLEE